MLQNRLIVTKKSDREKIYDLSKNKWIIELDGDKINDWSDFYDIMQKEIDVVDYNGKFGRNIHTYNDFATDIEFYNEIKKRKVEGITIILDYTENFKNTEEGERGYIYYDIVFTLLLEWYRDLRIVYQQEKPTINIELYILINDSLLSNKKAEFINELIIAIEDDRQQITEEYRDYEMIELRASTKKNNSLLKEIIKEKIENKNLEKIKILISNSDGFRFTNERDILVYIIDNILMEKYEENKEVKVYMTFENEM